MYRRQEGEERTIDLESLPLRIRSVEAHNLRAWMNVADGLVVVKENHWLALGADGYQILVLGMQLVHHLVDHRVVWGIG
jgi:hypothetical protein